MTTMGTAQAQLADLSELGLHAAQPDRARAAVVVVDMQRFFDHIATPLLPAVNHLTASARRGDRPVVFTRHGHHDLAVDGGVLAEWWQDDLAIVDSPPWHLLDDLHVEAPDAIIDKTRYSAFYGTWLEAYLRRLGVTDVVVCGVMTNCCIETTCRDAFMRDFRVWVPVDATATESPDLHRGALASLGTSCAVLSSADGLALALSPSAAA
jgi:nicotinamidase-related amidase